ncbi:MAG: N-acetylmuramoyl-L-alanine amidase, partial [Acidobacteriota bacterium]|nr:N-acetylmuramoyl-L-alanine amidase [Acidobacteriota bacterium]
MNSTTYLIRRIPPCLALALSASFALAQAAKPTPTTAKSATSSQPRNAVPINRNLVVLDAAHGGSETGAKFGDQTLEKDVTLALAARLRPALAAAGFTVVSTREAELANPLSTDQRAELANRQHAAACLILHATPIGSGVHLYISSLPQTPPPVDLDPDTRPPFEPIPWDSAQAAYAAQSLHLQAQLFSALTAGGLAARRGRGPVRPLDNLLCPAVVVEIAPLGAPGSGSPVTDAAYQQR